MKKKVMGAILLGLAFSLQIEAQLVDTSVLKKYPAAVLSRIAAITKHVSLPAKKQELLAAYFQKNDSLVAAWLAERRPVAQIDSLQNSVNRNLTQVLSSNEMNSYNRSAAAQFAVIAGEGEIQYLQQEYKPDSSQLRLIHSFVKDKYNFIYHKYLLHQSAPEKAKAVIGQVNKIYDTYAFYPQLYANKFVSSYLASLSAVKPISDTILKKISGAFYSGLRSNKYTDWGKSLADITRYHLPDTALFSRLHADLFKKEAASASAIEKNKLVYVHHISYKAFDSVYHLIWKKHYNNALLQYTYGTYYPRLCDSLIHQNTQHYDSCTTARLIRDGSMQQSTQLAMALKYKDALKLRPELTDTLVACVMRANKMRDSAAMTSPFSWLNTEAYESQQLTAILTEEQYTQLLAIKNRPASNKTAQRDWEDMERLQITKELNKETTINQLTNYYIAHASSWTRFSHDRIARTKAVRAVEENKPKALKMLEDAKWKTLPAGTASGLKLQW